MSYALNKGAYFLEKHVDDQRRFECQLCKRSVKSKRSILNHLFKQHGLSPLKPTNRLYLTDESRAVPRSTIYRWKSSKSRKSLPFGESEIEDCSCIVQSPSPNDETDNDFNQTVTNDEISSSGSLSSYNSDTYSISSTDISSTVSSECGVSDFESSEEISRARAFMLLNCFKKHNLTSSACSDILRTIRHVLPEVRDSSLLHYGKVLSFTPATNYKGFHYCNKCEYIFPRDRQNIQCETENCGGVVKNFMLADVKELLKNLLKTPGIMEDIKKTLDNVEGNVNSGILTDIHDGELYKQHTLHLNNLNSLQQIIHLTAILNTDGVNLYTSSKVELWPVYLAINELNPALRFSRENILLIGLWQGKGKPPFQKYFECISEEINFLTQNGLVIETEEGSVTVFLTVVGVTLDLPAKAGVLNMTLYNGLQACITCEEPGITVAQGRGYCRSYPYRPLQSRFQTRSSENAVQLMNAASAKKRQKGFKGLSGLAYLSKFDLVYGTVPDYMHCVLLGIVKTVMSKWFSPVESGKEYFIGKHLKQVSERLLRIKPPYFIERLPRDLEKHYANLKATELQAFLLYYAVPCLHGILDEKFLQHFALLSEAIFILLGDSITSKCLERTEFLLNKFYSQFSDLYGEGSCGLNVHNACQHMTEYVRKLGPIWCWSCFAFEDANAMILKSVHGTGNVVKQALQKQEIAMYIRSSNEVKEVSQKRSKVTYQAQNCEVLGSLKPVGNSFPDNIMEFLGVANIASLRKTQRIIVNGEKFYCAEYSRMKRRNCHAVLHSGDQFGLVQYFVLVLQTNLVYAVLKEMKLRVYSLLDTYEAAKHLKPVVQSNSLHIVAAEQLKDTLLFIDLENRDEAIVVKRPNGHGHAILK